MQERQCFAIAVLPILGEPATTIEPSKRAFDDPAFWQHCKSVRAIGTFDDLHRQMRANLGQSGNRDRPLCPAALCRGIADPSMQLLRGFSNVVKRVLDLGLYLLTTLQ